jgi:tryptophan 2,3-dioxygenase
MKDPGLYYADYLCLGSLLQAQHPESRRRSQEAHDEMLFIITHQTYELWFKQILHELRSVLDLFASVPMDERKLGIIVARLERVLAIQKLLNQQIGVLETMTPLDFLDFRNYLMPASGFQSVQFREIELRLGLGARLVPAAFDRLADRDRDYLEQIARETSLFECIDAWLARTPFLAFEGFNFWESYRQAVTTMLETDRRSILGNPLLASGEKAQQLAGLNDAQHTFDALFEPDGFQALRDQGLFRLCQGSVLSALFINLYRDEPILHLPFRLLTHLMDIDEQLTAWRSGHALMTQRMLGTKIGTGGTSGHEYLRRTVDKKRIFVDLYNLSTFLIPRSALPVLPPRLKQSLGFCFTGEPRV